MARLTRDVQCFNMEMGRLLHMQCYSIYFANKGTDGSNFMVITLFITLI